MIFILVYKLILVYLKKYLILSLKNEHEKIIKVNFNYISSHSIL